MTLPTARLLAAQPPHRALFARILRLLEAALERGEEGVEETVEAISLSIAHWPAQLRNIDLWSLLRRPVLSRLAASINVHSNGSLDLQRHLQARAEQGLPHPEELRVRGKFEPRELTPSLLHVRALHLSGSYTLGKRAVKALLGTDEAASLESLSLRLNGMRTIGEALAEAPRIPNLRRFEIEGAHVSASIVDFLNRPELESLDELVLVDNGHGEEDAPLVLDAILQRSRLKSLALWALDDAGFTRVLEKFAMLDSLSVKRSLGAPEREFSQVFSANTGSLRSLDLGFCKLDDPGFLRCEALSQLRALSVHSGLLGDALGEALRDSKAPIEALDVSHCDLGPRGYECLAQAPFFNRLRALRLSDNPVSFDSVARFDGGLPPGLVELEMASCDLPPESTDRLLQLAMGLPQLSRLCLDENALTSRGFALNEDLRGEGVETSVTSYAPEPRVERTSVLWKREKERRQGTKNPWPEIDEWLLTNAPLILAELNPPLSAEGEEALAALESEVGHPLPPDLLEAWRAHDGERGHSAALFRGAQPANWTSDMRWYSAREAHRAYRKKRDREKVPIGSNAAGDVLYVHVRTGAILAQDNETHELHTVSRYGFRAWMEELFAAMRSEDVVAEHNLLLRLDPRDAAGVSPPAPGHEVRNLIQFLAGTRAVEVSATADLEDLLRAMEEALGTPRGKRAANLMEVLLAHEGIDEVHVADGELREVLSEFGW